MNRSSDSILSVYSDARTEYTKQLCVYLVPAFFQFFIELLEKSKKVMVNEPKRVLWQLQNYLNEIHDWNMEKVNNEIHMIYTNCGCDYLEDLLTAVFIAHTKVLTAIRLSANNKKVEITVPKVEHFLFKVLCETSKLLWSSTYLFRDGISGIEKQQNYRTIETILNEGILLAIRNLVPVKSILKSFVNNDSADTTESSNSTADANADDDSDDEVDKKGPAEISITKSHDIEPHPLTETVGETLHSDETAPITSAVDAALTPVSTATASTATASTPPMISLDNPQNEAAPTIIIEDKPTVRFGEFNAMFDSEDPDKSDMIHQEDNDENDNEDPVLEILDEVGISLSSDVDFINLDESPKDSTGEPEQISTDDYEEL